MRKESLIEEVKSFPHAFETFPKPAVTDALAQLGYGPSKMLVDTFYLSKTDGPLGVGVLKVTKEHCKDHFGLLRGVDQVEAIAQSFILTAHFSGKIEKGQRPLFREIEGFVFDLPVVEGAILNLLVRPVDFESEQFWGLGQVVVGNTTVASGTIEGSMSKQELIRRIVERREREQKRVDPHFPLVDFI